MSLVLEQLVDLERPAPTQSTVLHVLQHMFQVQGVAQVLDQLLVEVSIQLLLEILDIGRVLPEEFSILRIEVTLGLG